MQAVIELDQKLNLDFGIKINSMTQGLILQDKNAHKKIRG